MKIELNTVISHRDDVLTSDLQNEMVMMDTERGLYYGLEEIGTRIWKIIAQPITVDSLVTQLTTEYQVERDVCVKDTINLLNDFYVEGLIIVHS